MRVAYFDREILLRMVSCIFDNLNKLITFRYMYVAVSEK